MCLCPFLAGGYFRIWLYDFPLYTPFSLLIMKSPSMYFPSVSSNIFATLFVSESVE